MHKLSSCSGAIVLAFLFGPSTSAQFGEPQVVLGYYPNGMEQELFVDLDFDGTLDLITASSSSYVNELRWYRGIGPDRVRTGQPLLGPLQGPSAFVYGDMNGDGFPDLVVATYIDDQVVLALGNGFGEFTLQDTLATNLDGPTCMRAEDLDGDGDPDLIVSSENDDRIACYANDGQGNFGPQQDLTTSATNITRFDLADLDNDGDLDVLYHLYPAIDPSIIWFPNDGFGGFGAAATLYTHTSFVYFATAGDLDSDGLTDLIFHSSTGARWAKGLGGGTFGAGQTLSTSTGRYLLPGDMDGDGDLDLLVKNDGVSMAEVLLNDGLGNFTLAGPGVVSGTNSARLQDLNGDGLLDVVFPNGNHADYAYNQGGGILGPLHRVVEWYNAKEVRPADMDGDGDMDLVIRQGQYAPVTLLRNDGDGNFIGAYEFMTQGDPVISLYLHDFDQDGLKDVLYVDVNAVVGDLLWQRNLGGGNFAPEALLTPDYTYNITYSGVGSVLVEADFNGDGLLDHLMNYPKLGWRAKSATNYGPHQLIDWDNTNTIMAVADLDNDGDMDVIGIERSVSSAYGRWYRNDGSGNFTHEAIPPMSNSISSIHPFDFDGDGDVDVAVARTGGDLDLLFNDGNGVFTKLAQPNWGSSGQIAVLDVDLDGDLDLITGGGQWVGVWTNDGLGVFTSTAYVSLGGTGNPSVLVAHDMDLDGAMEVIACRGDWLSLLHNNVGSYYRIEGRVYGDLDADGVRDPQEPTVPWASVVAEPAPGFPLANNNGTYICYVDSGTYTVRAMIDTVLWQISSDSAQYTVHLDSLNPASTGRDFGITANAPAPFVDLGFVPDQGLCGDTVHQYIHFANLGNRVERGWVSFEQDPLHITLSADPPPDSVVAGRYYWSFDPLFYYESRSITLLTVRPSATDIGSPTFTQVQLITLDSLGVPDDTTAVYETGVVACSYDPNDKQVSPRGYGAFGAVDISTDHLHYTIRFQNTGTAPAHNVVLRDTLPMEVVPIGMHVLGFSHSPGDIRMDSTGVLSIKFPGINLPDSASDLAGSQGFITFRLMLEDNLPHLTTITNRAGIYFDLNPPIITDQTLTTLVDCDLWEPLATMSGGNMITATAGDQYQWLFNGNVIPGAVSQDLEVIQYGDYAVQVTSSYGCVGTSPPLTVLTTGIEDAGHVPFRLMPNPADDQVILSHPEVLSPAHVIELIDVQGKVVRRRPGTGSRTATIPLDRIAPGTYTVRVIGPDGQMSGMQLMVR